MDFSNRIQHQTVATNGAVASSAAAGSTKKSQNFFNSKGWRLAITTLLAAIAVLILAIVVLFVINNKGEYAYVNTKAFQAVDINVSGNSSDQIYFGNIKSISDRYVILENVYFIPQNSSSSGITLQPLVCLVDAPYNRMVINRNSVNWWENLQSNGKVAQAITKYQSQSNPSCPSAPSTSSSSSSSNSSTSTTGTTAPTSSSSSSTGTTGSSTTSTSSTTKKP